MSNKADLKKMLVCRHPINPTQNLPTQKTLLLCYQRNCFFVSKKHQTETQTSSSLEMQSKFILFVMLQHTKFNSKKMKISSKKYKPVRDEIS